MPYIKITGDDCNGVTGNILQLTRTHKATTKAKILNTESGLYTEFSHADLYWAMDTEMNVKIWNFISTDMKTNFGMFPS